MTENTPKPLDPEKKKRALEQISLVIAYQNVFSTPMGQKVLEDLKKAHFVDSVTFVENPQTHAYREGQRAVVLRILSTLKVDLQKQKEQVEQNVQKK